MSLSCFGPSYPDKSYPVFPQIDRARTSAGILVVYAVHNIKNCFFKLSQNIVFILVIMFKCKFER